MMIKIIENKTLLSCLSNDKNTKPGASTDILVPVQRRGQGLKFVLSYPAHPCHWPQNQMTAFLLFFPIHLSTKSGVTHRQ